MQKPQSGPWYTVGFDELRFIERNGPAATAYQRRYLRNKIAEWDWENYRRQAKLYDEVCEQAAEYEQVLNSLTKTQAERIIDEIKVTVTQAKRQTTKRRRDSLVAELAKIFDKRNDDPQGA